MSANGAKDWRPCSPGELSDLSRRLRHRRQTRRAFQGSVAGGVVAAAITAGFLLSDVAPRLPGTPAPIAELSCEEVQRLVSPFISGRLEPELRERVVGHLDHCEVCHSFYRRKGAIS